MPSAQGDALLPWLRERMTVWWDLRHIRGIDAVRRTRLVALQQADRNGT